MWLQARGSHLLEERSETTERPVGDRWPPATRRGAWVLESALFLDERVTALVDDTMQLVLHVVLQIQP